MEYKITTTWDSLPVTHQPVQVRYSPGEGGLKMEVVAHYFNSPPPPDGPPGNFPGLWAYEGGWKAKTI